MKIQKKKNLLTIIVTLLILFSIIPVFYCDTDDYEIDVDENGKVVWEVTDVDEDELDNLLSLSDLDADEFDYEEEDRIKYEINSISEVPDEYYVINYNYYENDEDLGAKSEKIAMDPGDMAEDWEDLSLDDYSVMFVLTDTKDYLDEFGDEVSDSYKKFIYNSGSSIILNGTIGGFLFWLEMDYDDRGIIEEFTLVYDGQEIFKMEQKNYSRSTESPFLLLVILIIIGIIILSGVVALIVVLSKKAKKQKKVITPTPIISPYKSEGETSIKTNEVTETEVKKEPEKTEYCPNCGSEKEKDAVFCTYCGSKF
jgi:hypothetical protein